MAGSLWPPAVQCRPGGEPRLRLLLFRARQKPRLGRDRAPGAMVVQRGRTCCWPGSGFAPWRYYALQPMAQARVRAWASPALQADAWVSLVSLTQGLRCCPGLAG